MDATNTTTNGGIRAAEERRRSRPSSRSPSRSESGAAASPAEQQGSGHSRPSPRTQNGPSAPRVVRPEEASTRDVAQALRWLQSSEYYGDVLPSGSYFRAPTWFLRKRTMFHKRADGTIVVVDGRLLPRHPSPQSVPPTGDRGTACRRMAEDDFYGTRPVGTIVLRPSWYTGPGQQFIRDRITNQWRPCGMLDLQHNQDSERMQAYYLRTRNVDVLE